MVGSTGKNVKVKNTRSERKDYYNYCGIIMKLMLLITMCKGNVSATRTGRRARWTPT
jgi:hypothetical protein